MTFSLTSPGCPIGPQVSEQIEEFVSELDGVDARLPEDGLHAAVDARADERRSEVRARLLSVSLSAVRPLRVLLDCFPRRARPRHGGLARDDAARAPPASCPRRCGWRARRAVVAFAKHDALAPGYARGRRGGRGGRASRPCCGSRAGAPRCSTRARSSWRTPCPTRTRAQGIHARFEATAELIARALRRLGVDARVGEVPGEYCPGRWSVNARGERKLAGIGQRLIAAARTWAACSWSRTPPRVRRVLVPVYEALGLDWEPATVGAVADEAPGQLGRGPRRPARRVRRALRAGRRQLDDARRSRSPQRAGAGAPARRATSPPARPAGARRRARRVSTIASTICGQTCSGRSWPIPAMATRRAPGIARAVARPPRNGTSGSARPWMTSASARAAGAARGAVARGDDRGELAAGAGRVVPALVGSRRPPRACAPRRVG